MLRRRAHGSRRYTKFGKVRSKAAGQSLTIRVPGKLAKRLARGGRFRATAVATDPAGNKSKTKTIALRIQTKNAR
jgi:D-tyrosyl-tRNA(Tyr) deacylase